MKTLKVSAIELSMKTKKGSCIEAIKELKNLFKRYGITMKGLLETEGLCAVLEDGKGNEVERVDDASEAEKPNTFSMNAHLSILCIFHLIFPPSILFVLRCHFV